MPYRLAPVTAASIASAPPPCVECVFWQSRGTRNTDKERWAERVEDDWGAWGTFYFAEDDRQLGFIQFGPSWFFQRARTLPAGPPSDDAVLDHLRVPARRVVALGAPEPVPVVIGEARDRGVKAIEAFGYKYPEGESGYERFFVHKTIFPSDFLADFGFQPLRWEGRVALGRLDLGGLQPVAEERGPRCCARCRRRSRPPVPQR